MKPDDFILTSDFATVKSDTFGATATVTVPSAVSVAAGATVEYTADISGGSSGAALRCRIRSSKASSAWLAAPQVVYTRTGSLGLYSLVALVYLLAPGTVRCSVRIFNDSGSTMTTEAGAETIDFVVSTFIPPFP